MLISFSSNKFQRDLSGGTGRGGGGGGGGNTPRNSWWALCRTVLQIMTLFQTNKFHILTPLHNINRQNVKANKFILGRLGENQP